MSADAALSRYLRDQELGEAIQDYADDHGITYEEAERILQEGAEAEAEAYWEAMAEAQAAQWDELGPYEGVGGDW